MARCAGFLLIALTWLIADAKVGSKLCFKHEFVFAISTAAYQIEGAWNVAGKGESIWDRYTHEHPELVFDHSNGDVATDSYHRFKEDVKLLAALGVSFYRFSMSWPRILPTGVGNKINNDGVRYYKELLAELRQNNITAVVTMYHWDLPQSLQDLGGWTNPIMVDYFVDYAYFLFVTFGNHVKAWITFNGPSFFCGEGYGGDHAPGRRASGVEDYMCAHNVLKAHAKVYKMYKEQFDLNDMGFVGISLDVPWMEPATSSKADEVAAETARQFLFGWFAHPIFSKKGGYPPIMRSRVDFISKRQGFPRSRLPFFTNDEVAEIRGSADFLGLNHYTTNLVKPADAEIRMEPNFQNDIGVKFSSKLEPQTNSTWLRVASWGLRKALNWIKNTYHNPAVVVTENGISLEKGLKDTWRVSYIDSYLRALHAAIYKDNCDVQGYMYSTLLDNFEWTKGFSERFGLFEVDYTSPELTRTPRLSAQYFATVVKSGCIPEQDSWIFGHNSAALTNRFVPMLLKAGERGHSGAAGKTSRPILRLVRP